MTNLFLFPPSLRRLVFLAILHALVPSGSDVLACSSSFASYKDVDIVKTLDVRTVQILEYALDQARPEHYPDSVGNEMKVKIVGAEPDADGMYIHYYAMAYMLKLPDGRFQFPTHWSPVHVVIHVDSSGWQTLVSSKKIRTTKFRNAEGIGLGEDPFKNSSATLVTLSDPIELTGFRFQNFAMAALLEKYGKYRDEIDLSSLQFEIVGADQYRSGPAVKVIVRGYRNSPHTGQPVTHNGITTDKGFPLAVYTEITQATADLVADNMVHSRTRSVTWRAPRPSAFMIDSKLVNAAKMAMNLKLSDRPRDLEISVVGYRVDNLNNLTLLGEPLGIPLVTYKLLDKASLETVTVELGNIEGTYFMMSEDGVPTFLKDFSNEKGQ